MRILWPEETRNRAREDAYQTTLPARAKSVAARKRNEKCRVKLCGAGGRSGREEAIAKCRGIEAVNWRIGRRDGNDDHRITHDL